MENMGINPELWKDKRVFLTGHTGFKGGWMALALNNLGAKVFGYSLAPSSRAFFFRKANVNSYIKKSVFGDVRDLEHLREALKESDADIVIHMAAQAIVQRSYKNPLETYSTNVLGTANILEASLSVPNIKAIINVTTDKCYENNEWYWAYREEEKLGGKDPYSSSKACSEIISHAYRESFLMEKNISLATARAGNVIGGGDWAEDRLVPDIVRALLQGKTPEIRNPSAVRPWQHVLEPVTGYLLLAQALYLEGNKFAEAWNFGPEQRNTLDVDTLVKLMLRKWGEGENVAITKEQFFPEAGLLRLDSSKAQARLKWIPVLDIEKTIEMTVEWYKRSHESEDLEQFSLGQIKEYLELVKSYG